MTPLIVTAQQLASELGDPALRIFDCTVRMTPRPVGPSIVESGRPDWEKAHIPGAHYLHMLDDLAEPEGHIAYKLPGAAKMEALLRRHGVNDGDSVVLYGAGYPATVTRAFWVLAASGVENIRLLNGGWEAWKGARLPTTVKTPPFAPGGFHARPRPELLATLDEVVVSMDDHRVQLVNALSPEQFLGIGGAHYGRPGRIPNSLSLPVRNLFDATSLEFAAAPEIRVAAERAGLDPGKRQIVYCGGGIAASGVFFALKLAGYADVALYDGSLLEWCANPELPLVCGRE